jgi:adsorption protein B
MENLFVVFTYIVVLGALLFTFDDLFIDFISLIKNLKPRLISKEELEEICEQPEKSFAIMIANWKEADVIAPMIRGNLKGLQYDNYTFFLGVYPNDIDTWKKARLLEELYPEKVVVVVNSQIGPTSKGQMLNEIARKIILAERNTGKTFDLFLMQDSEDVLHPYSLSLLNAQSSKADFIQIPVFSFDVPLTNLIGAIYIDEFSEAHTKDLLVRESLGAAVPSAGVGTMISRALMLSLMKTQNGSFLKEDTLTEDYHLGLSTKPLGYRSHFLCAQIENKIGKNEFVATREYFPDHIGASIRQKSRWTLGIAYQGSENLQWHGELVDRYFMLRDRRGPTNGILFVMSLIVLVVFIAYYVTGTELPQAFSQPVFVSLVALNMLNMGMRLIQRMRAVARVNHPGHVLIVPVRWLIANFVNLAAAIKAHRSFRTSKKTGQRPAWIKTDHRLPSHFGEEAEV